MELEEKKKVLESQIKILEGVADTLEKNFASDEELVDACSFLTCVIKDIKERL